VQQGPTAGCFVPARQEIGGWEKPWRD
jgi:hypothetical protein